LASDPARSEPKLGGALALVSQAGEARADAIDAFNRPEQLHPDLAQPPYSTYDAALRTGTTTKQPFASSWWDMTCNGIACRWALPNRESADMANTSDRLNLSPAEKYDQLVYPNRAEVVAAVAHWNVAELLPPGQPRPPQHTHPAVRVMGPTTAWEMTHHGVYSSYAHPDTWEGHCNGWAGYVTTEPDPAPRRDIWVRLEGGAVRECSAGQSGCVLFRMGDIEGLMSEVHFSMTAAQAGRACSANPLTMPRDAYGRSRDPRCRDLNPGTLHTALVGLMARGVRPIGAGGGPASAAGLDKPTLVIDASYDWQVQSHPVVKFDIVDQQEINAAEANRLVGDFRPGYSFNPEATRFVRVKTRVWKLLSPADEKAMLLPATMRTSNAEPTEYNYILELKDVLGQRSTIIGGEWIREPVLLANNDSRVLHPDFAWLGIKAMGDGDNPTDDTSNAGQATRAYDNPMLSYPIVRGLLQCSNHPETCNRGATPSGMSVLPPPTPPSPPTSGAGLCLPSNCGSAAPVPSGTSLCYCDPSCGQYGVCCSNYQAVCGASTPATPSVATASCRPTDCGKPNPLPSPGIFAICYCDTKCTAYRDCCKDYATVCRQ
jgi:hypothetical protein